MSLAQVVINATGIVIIVIGELAYMLVVVALTLAPDKGGVNLKHVGIFLGGLISAVITGMVLGFGYLGKFTSEVLMGMPPHWGIYIAVAAVLGLIGQIAFMILSLKYMDS